MNETTKQRLNNAKYGALYTASAGMGVTLIGSATKVIASSHVRKQEINKVNSCLKDLILAEDAPTLDQLAVVKEQIVGLKSHVGDKADQYLDQVVGNIRILEKFYDRERPEEQQHVRSTLLEINNELHVMEAYAWSDSGNVAGATFMIGLIIAGFCGWAGLRRWYRTVLPKRVKEQS